MNATAGAGAFNAPNTSIAAPGSVSNGGSYACARCHTTGMTLDTAVSTTRPPDRTYPGINGYVSFDPDGNGPATTVSWATGFSSPFQTLEGVQCERCHDATRHFSTDLRFQEGGWYRVMPPMPQTGAYGNVCQRRPRARIFHPTPFTDNSAIPVSEPTYSLPAIESAGPTAVMRGHLWIFDRHGIPEQRPCPVHGNFQQINTATKYSSVFRTGPAIWTDLPYTISTVVHPRAALGPTPEGAALTKRIVK